MTVKKQPVPLKHGQRLVFGKLQVCDFTRLSPWPSLWQLSPFAKKKALESIEKLRAAIVEKHPKATQSTRNAYIGSFLVRKEQVMIHGNWRPANEREAELYAKAKVRAETEYQAALARDQKRRSKSIVELRKRAKQLGYELVPMDPTLREVVAKRKTTMAENAVLEVTGTAKTVETVVPDAELSEPMKPAQALARRKREDARRARMATK